MVCSLSVTDRSKSRETERADTVKPAFIDGGAAVEVMRCVRADDQIVKVLTKKSQRIAVRPTALLVIAIDSAADVTSPAIARMQSTVSTTTSASWWIAWNR